MPYSLMCSSGYVVPEREGRMEVTAINVVGTAPGAEIQVALRDHFDTANPLANDPDNTKNVIFRATKEGHYVFPTPIKILRGLRAYQLSPNTEVSVYIR
jgi:hypothetical protein